MHYVCFKNTLILNIWFFLKFNIIKLIIYSCLQISQYGHLLKIYFDPHALLSTKLKIDTNDVCFHITTGSRYKLL